MSSQPVFRSVCHKELKVFRLRSYKVQKAVCHARAAKEISHGAWSRFSNCCYYLYRRAFSIIPRAAPRPIAKEKYVAPGQQHAQKRGTKRDFGRALSPLPYLEPFPRCTLLAIQLSENQLWPHYKFPLRIIGGCIHAYRHSVNQMSQICYWRIAKLVYPNLPCAHHSPAQISQTTTIYPNLSQPALNYLNLLCLNLPWSTATFPTLP